MLADEILDRDKVQKVFEKIIKRHSTLRTEFVIQEDNVVQKIKDSVEFSIPIFKNTENEINNIVNNFVKPFKY